MTNDITTTLAGRAALARYCGVSEQTIQSWCEQGLPRTKIGRQWTYNSREVTRWLVAQRTNKPRDTTNREKLERLKAERMELQVAQMRKELAPIRAMEDALREYVIFARTHLLSATNQWEDPAHRSKYEAIIRQALSGMVAKLEAIEAGEKDIK